jgi:catechol 2,3-dioxygenase-like lactoylglutathione lyase family enzyme
MLCKKLHHAAFRCKSAVETTRFYRGVLGLKFSHAIAQALVPSTGQYSPHIHIFFEMEDGSSIAFFECPDEPGEVKDMASPAWIQHFAFQVQSPEVLQQAKAELEALGLQVLGPVNHGGFVLSIYFVDPSGHRLELTTPICAPEQLKDFETQAPLVLQHWADARSADHRLPA